MKLTSCGLIQLLLPDYYSNGYLLVACINVYSAPKEKSKTFEIFQIT